jgi:uncharacterized protein with von Willebrand factor type A (vWA) domain
LESLRIAHAERRRCFVYAFGGPAQVVEHELELSPEGIARLLAFLGRSFGGGTDLGVMSDVLWRLDEDGWKRADVVVVSDGEWPAPPDLVARVQAAREAGTRFHGIQIGNRGRSGLHQLCDPVHEFGDWTAVTGWGTRKGSAARQVSRRHCGSSYAKIE